LEYSWSTEGGQLSTINSPVTVFTANDLGQYLVTVVVTNRITGCSESVTSTISVTDAPKLTASSNSPICADQGLMLLGTDGADSYVWTGPNGFTSTEQNPELRDVTSSSAGEYLLQATFGSCIAETVTLVEIGGELDAVLIGEPIACLGGNLVLSIDRGTSFEWTGPNNFTSTSQEITISNVKLSDAGIYEVSAFNDEGIRIIR